MIQRAAIRYDGNWKLGLLGLAVWGAAISRSAADIAAAQLAYTLAHYARYEYKISMRDGVRLFAAVYIPKDAALHLINR